MLYAVIMAGGTGQRFWPLSRRARPKQFLPLMGDRTMLQATVDRLTGWIPEENIIVVTGQAYLDTVSEQLPRIGNVLGEPCGRDTAAAVGLAARQLVDRDPAAVMAVLPADHFIADPERFQTVLRAAAGWAAGGEWLVTMGVPPTRPDTGYGYIRRGEKMDGDVYRVERFTEKPDAERAREFLASGRYLWNSGMFVWRADLILRLIARYLPELAAGLAGIGRGEKLAEVYPRLPRISIDYGVMERADRVLVLPGDFGWDDVGSWPALCREAGENVLEAKGVFLETTGSIIRVPGRVVATLGIRDLVVVDDGDCLLVCAKERAVDLKLVTGALAEAGFADAL
ncbi:MAG: mannose-1-phosphate guanylyltransferase [Peptococcaceae bacterium]|jgi:mannose-1-phosphate guanylyltransferase|nr:mannose-1-phosphate guanylyltransferase [Peptococcaceae bacterium]